jgi:hypothetical protein
MRDRDAIRLALAGGRLDNNASPDAVAVASLMAELNASRSDSAIVKELNELFAIPEDKTLLDVIKQVKQSADERDNAIVALTYLPNAENQFSINPVLFGRDLAPVADDRNMTQAEKQAILSELWNRIDSIESFFKALGCEDNKPLTPECKMLFTWLAVYIITGKLERGATESHSLVFRVSLSKGFDIQLPVYMPAV